MKPSFNSTTLSLGLRSFSSAMPLNYNRNNAYKKGFGKNGYNFDGVYVPAAERFRRVSDGFKYGRNSSTLPQKKGLSYHIVKRQMRRTNLVTVKWQIKKLKKLIPKNRVYKLPKSSKKIL